MPRRRSPPCLRYLCLYQVTNMLSFIHQENRKTDRNVYKTVYKEFTDLICQCPSTILEDLIDLLHLQQPSGIDCFQLELLLGGNVCRLWLHYQDSKSLRNIPLGFQRILRRIGDCGSQITDLSLKGCLLWNYEELIRTIRSLKNLRRLVLHSSKLDDDVLIAVGESCSLVVEVSFSGWSITDRGLKGLVDSSDTPPPLRSIVLESDRYYVPKITKEVVVYLLKRLPHLEQLKVPHLTDALLVLAEEQKQTEQVTTYPLRIYHDDLQGAACSVDLMKGVIGLCPFITDIRIAVNDISTLLVLSNLKHLAALAIVDLSLQSGDLFYEGVVHLLKKCGRNIVNLELAISEVDLALIDNLCPILTSFECTKVSRFRRTIKVRENPFSNLVNLKLFAEEVNGIRESDLFFLLSGCKSLRILFLGWCDALTDETLKSILHINPLRDLKEAEISDISSITVDGLLHFILTENDLHRLNIMSCDSVLRQDIVMLRNVIKESNLDVEIKFYE